MITIKDFHVGIRNLCDFVAVKTNNRDASFGVKVNRSVARLPVDALLNSGTHFRFDLTHERKMREGTEKERRPIQSVASALILNRWAMRPTRVL